ncbi:Gfo/Idh/MocA family oxidoreductase [Dactylosporangium sp. NPDC005572]|uniref:Gfo/Idh/MocA family protein n=1 Tax=Dactylosporangium sp. NPDC005572 TaxID=3156889 RepID=UPI0033AA6AAD
MTGSGAGLVGYGYWGPNFARLLAGHARLPLRAVVDPSPQRRAAFQAAYPRLPAFAELDGMLADPSVGAVVIATPPRTHAALTRRVLATGRHVLVEKPLATSAGDAVELARAAEAAGVVLMVGHTFEFVPGIRRMREAILGDELGPVRYLHLQRLNRGRANPDVDVLWSLGPHDVAIANHLVGTSPDWVSARSFRTGHGAPADVAFLTLGYPGAVVAHVHLSWADHVKVRRTVVVGAHRMLTYDDAPPGPALAWRDGIATQAVPLPATEPLAAELEHFIDCVTVGTPPLTDGWNGIRVVAALEAADRSVRDGGRSTEVVLPAGAVTR